MAEPDLHAPLGVYDWNAAWITGEIATRNPDPAVLPGAMPMETPDRPGPAQDAGMDGPAIGA